MRETDVPVSYSVHGIPEKSICKASLEEVLRKLLSFLKPETFVGAIRAINQKILSVLDDTESGRVDLGMFFAVISPVCSGTLDKRKKVAYESLSWRAVNEGSSQIRRSDSQLYIKLLRAIYIPCPGNIELLELRGETDDILITLPEFVTMFDDEEWGFSILSTLPKLEVCDRIRHGRHVCATCRYPIIGLRFKDTKLHFSLCCQCYCEGQVPSSSASSTQDEFLFKEYAMRQRP